MQRQISTRAFRSPWITGVVTACALLPSAALGQTSASPNQPPNARPTGLPQTRFDLARLTAPTDVTNHDTIAGDDVEVAPGLVAGIGAAERRRGAGAPLDTVAPAFQRQAELSGRLGLAVGERGLLFGRLGYAEFDLNEAFARSDARSLSAGGVLVGAGAEARLSPALSLRTEVHSVNYRTDLSDRQLLGGLAWHY